MKKIIGSILILVLFFLITSFIKVYAQELLTTSWHLERSSNGDVNLYQTISDLNILQGKESIQVTYNLHGNCLRQGLDSSLIFNQGEWRWVSLYNYGNNCFDGEQTVNIPLSAFTGLNINNPLTGTSNHFHIRVWMNNGFIIDITSVVLINAPTPTPTPTPTPSRRWNIQSVDAMKVTKDVICNQKSDEWINQWLDRAVEVGANYVAISQPYDNPTCGSSVEYTQKWISSIRSHNLKVWHRHTPLAFEGIYNTNKNKNDYYYDLISGYIKNNPTFFQEGDIFTPIPEPQNGGIQGVTYCSFNVCQFSGQKDFNNWLKSAMLISELSFETIGLKDKIKIGYFGFDGFVTWGDNNPDWHGILTDSTVARMGNITLDHYPASTSDMATDLTEFRIKYPSAELIIGEWGAKDATNEAEQVIHIQNTYNAFINQTNLTGVNYWHMGTGGKESLLNSDLTKKSGFDIVREYFFP